MDAWAKTTEGTMTDTRPMTKVANRRIWDLLYSFLNTAGQGTGARILPHRACGNKTPGLLRQVKGTPLRRSGTQRYTPKACMKAGFSRP
jgi:hypothetical protein